MESTIFDTPNDIFKDEKLHLVSRKGIFPYSSFDGETEMAETSLPPRDDFLSNLTEEDDYSEEDYSHAQTVWKKFGMTTFKRIPGFIFDDGRAFAR